VNEKERFEAWIRKLSDSGVVLVHGTQSEAVNHGTPKLFEDLKLRFPSFEFVHGDGLGIVGVGAELPPTLAEFLAIGRKPKQMEHIGRIYGQLGKRLQEIERMKTAALENERELERLNSAISVWRSESDRLRTALSRAQAEAERVRGLLSAAQQDTGRALLEVEQSLAERSRLQVALSDLAKERNRLQAELDGVVSSTSWRLTAPLRRFGNRTPSPKKLEQS